jgi:hypothetical protein
VDARQAVLVANVGVSLFHLAFGQWVRDPDGRGFGLFVHQALEDLHDAVPADS